MGFLANAIREKRSDFFESASMKNAPDWFIKLVGGASTKSGVSVNERKALGLTAVWSCIKIIAWTTASLPLHTYKKLNPTGKNRATDLFIYNMLHDAPNTEQTSFEWRSMTSAHQNLWGAGISEIEFDANGYPIALWPIPPWCVVPMRTAKKELVYQITVDGTVRYLRPEQVVVFQSLTTSRDYWLSPIGVHRETIGSAMAVREFGALSFGQGTNPAGILTGHWGNEESDESFKKKIKEGYEGLRNSHRLMLLEEGMKFEKIGLPPEDVQYLETRNFDISEIARIYNVPLHLLQNHEKSTSWGTGIEEMNIGFVTFTLLPYLVQWEQELNKKLIYSYNYFVKFSVDGLLRGKMSERFAAYAIGRQWGWYSPNDICEMEDRNPLPGDPKDPAYQGSIYLVPMNMVDARRAGQNPTPIKKEQTEEDPSAPQGKK